MRCDGGQAYVTLRELVQLTGEQIPAVEPADLPLVAATISQLTVQIHGPPWG
jgi:hypothetical protein